MEVRSPAEAIRSLCYQLPGFERFLRQSADHGIEYRVVVEDPEGRSEDELYYPMGGYDVIVIAPIASGCGGFGKILLGAVLIGAAFAFPAGILGASSLMIGVTGAALFLQGVGTLIADNKKTPKDREKQDSFLFDRASEVGKQGSPVALLAGERILELTVVLSLGITTSEIPV